MRSVECERLKEKEREREEKKKETPVIFEFKKNNKKTKLLFKIAELS